MATGFNVRVGDTERDAVATQLREHYADGRLTLDELNERLDQAFAARTRADLNAVTRDLPSTGRPAASPPAGAGRLPDWNGQSRRSGQGNGSGAGNARPRRGGLLAAAAFLLPTLIAIGAFLVLGSFLALGFGFGGGRPLGIVFLFAAFALIRRMFGRRRRYVRGYGRCGRRW
jgi:hypothetical protein